jgi:REP-associated tyrosine transposase
MECQIIAGASDAGPRAYLQVKYPRKQAAASVIGFLKRKSAIAMARLCNQGAEFQREHFWAPGYAVSTVGFELEEVCQYIRDQEDADGTAGRF